MKKRTQDDYVRTALRLPPDLHKQVHERARESGRTFNAELNALLEDGMTRPGIDLRISLESTSRPTMDQALDVVKAVRKKADSEFASVQLIFVPFGEQDFLDVLERAKAAAVVDGDMGAKIIEDFLRIYGSASRTNHPTQMSRLKSKKQ